MRVVSYTISALAGIVLVRESASAIWVVVGLALIFMAAFNLGWASSEAAARNR